MPTCIVAGPEGRYILYIFESRTLFELSDDRLLRETPKNELCSLFHNNSLY